MRNIVGIIAIMAFSVLLGSALADDRGFHPDDPALLEIDLSQMNEEELRIYEAFMKKSDTPFPENAQGSVEELRARLHAACRNDSACERRSGSNLGPKVRAIPIYREGLSTARAVLAAKSGQ